MGYFINKITKDPEAQTAKVSLSDNPNFVTFSSNKENSNKPIAVTLDVIGDGYVAEIVNQIRGYKNIASFTIKEIKTGVYHKFSGTSDISKVGGENFYLGSFTIVPHGDKFQIAECLADTLRANSFFRKNFTVSLAPRINENGDLGRGSQIQIKSKNYARNCAFEIIPEHAEFSSDFVTITGNPQDTADNDSISEGHDTCEIRLDIYKDCNVFLGMDDKPDEDKLGTYATTLSKTYIGEPLWFNVNILGGSRPVMNFDKKEKAFQWFDSGTMKNFRFVAKRFINDSAKYENQTFFYSGVFYQLTGYGRTLEKNDLTSYVFDTTDNKILETDKEDKRNKKKIKLLTTQPELTHTAGQLQYLNFILSDPNRNTDESWKLGLLYKFYGSHGRPIDEVTENLTLPRKLNMVNTICLNLDSLLASRPAAARVEVCLCQYQEGDEYMEEPTIFEVSHPLRFIVMPECLYKVHDFVFLNRLGGWSSFNFPGTEKTDFKTKATSIYQTHTPDKALSSEIESVFRKELTESFTVESMPITREVCDWLKELSTSQAVYELSTGRYIIVDDLNIKHDTKEELFRMEMKFHYSDSYNARIE